MDKLHKESRKQFEEWWERECWDKKLENIQGVMFNRIKQGMFDSWLARQKSLVVELPELSGSPIHFIGDYRTSKAAAFRRKKARDAVINECADAIRSIGLSIKGE